MTYSGKMRNKPRKRDSGTQDTGKLNYDPVDDSADLRMNCPDSRWGTDDHWKEMAKKKVRTEGNLMHNMILKLQKFENKTNKKPE